MSAKKAGKKENLGINSILADSITELAQENWLQDQRNFDSSLVKIIYERYIQSSDITSGSQNNVQILNFSGYLEKYLWLHFNNNTSSFEHLLSILYLVNEKFKVNVYDIFDTLTQDEKKFQSFVKLVVEVVDDPDLPNKSYAIAYMKFLINFYKCLENPIIRKTGLRYLFLPMWEGLTNKRLNDELSLYPQLRKLWDNFKAQNSSSNLTESSQPVEESKTEKGQKSKGKTKKPKLGNSAESMNESQISKINPTNTQSSGSEGAFMKSIVMHLVGVLHFSEPNNIAFGSVTLELLCDLLSQLPTRRFLRTLLDDMNIVTKIKMSKIYQENDLIQKLLKSFESFLNFPFQDHSGKALSQSDVMNIYYKRMNNVQEIAYNHYMESMKDLVFCSIGRLLKEEELQKHLLLLSTDEIVDIGMKLGRISNVDIDYIRSRRSNTMSADDGDEDADIFQYTMNVLLDYLIPKQNQLEEINMLSLYPTEDMLWNENIMPPANYSSGDLVLALPKLNIQFLTLYDYLLRNFTLYRLESAYEIREDIMDAVKRIGPKLGPMNVVTFKGWARMALPMISISIDEVSKPKVGSPCPAFVHASVQIDVARFSGVLRDEWEALREHDVVFLVCIERPMSGEAIDKDFQKQYGIKYIRGAEVFEYFDEENIPLNDLTRPDTRPARVGSKRKLRVKLDPVQYYSDMKDGLNCYETLNLLIRRGAKESNFRAVLETIREIMNTDIQGKSLPTWISDVFLGYGNPSSANYRSLSKNDSFDYVDTFLDGKHVIESFNDATITFQYEGTRTSVDTSSTTEVIELLPSPPYKLSVVAGGNKKNILVEPYRIPTSGPYPDDTLAKNPVRFTPVQVEAIHSGMNPGLTMIVGPPGTGKTDTAVQIIANLYHNFPTQKIVVVTHSNAALNDIFMKIMERNVDPRHLLRLGSGERELRDSLSEASNSSNTETSKGEGFSKQGRVNYCLERRLYLLNKVQQLSQSMNIVGDYGSSCETADYFLKYHLTNKIQEFESKTSESKSVNINEIFPFHEYFSDVPEALFNGNYEHDIDAAQGCIRHLKRIFEELSDYRAFEILRTHTHRSDYLLLKQARIVAMTCTHAAISRSRLLELNFEYDSLIMEEAAQILDIETVIPMLLQHHNQNGDSNSSECRLKRIVLLGDHYQLSPIIQNLSLQKYSKFDQSLFERLVRLGVPVITLDKQGRARPEISALYNWRYQRINSQHGLGDLESIVVHNEIYQQANPGFLYNYQLIDVPEYKNRGEYCPTPYFYQNLGEAEYVVATYQYMRLMGYPSEKISILTSYNGQKQLIIDILNHRCKNSGIFGYPNNVATIDQYQGQQNDYILLSLVRTEAVGHIRDIRRLTVALSRARLGLYVFCRKELFENCYELIIPFQLLTKRPSNLQLVVNETYPSRRLNNESVDESKVFEVKDVTTLGVLVYQLTQHAMQSRFHSMKPFQDEMQQDDTNGNASNAKDGNETESAEKIPDQDAHVDGHERED